MSDIYIFTASNPTAREHLDTSVKSPIEEELLEQYLDQEQLDELSQKSDQFYAWGAQPGTRNIPNWKSIEDGDLVLVYIKGHIHFVSRIFYKVHNPALAEKIWGRENGETWEYMYFFYKPIELPGPVKCLDYDRYFYEFQGFTRLSDERKNYIIEDYGSYETFAKEVFNINLSKIGEQATQGELYMKGEKYTNKMSEPVPASNIPLNLILYGPPGTGKTFSTINYAVSIIEDKPVDLAINEDESKRQELRVHFDNYAKKGQIDFVTFHQSFAYEDFIEGIRPILSDGGQSNRGSDIKYEVKDGIFKRLVEKAISNPSDNYVLIIDEINRGNIANILGELITLIEPDKRKGKAEELTTILPYSGDSFTVPDNLYIIGTMNTADRSIEALDTALRRRFNFNEVQPNPTLLDGLKIDNIPLEDLLRTINNRITRLLDHEHQIGHSYFLSLEKSASKEDLKQIFEDRLIPLLKEYFYSDLGKIGLILGNSFIRAKSNGQTNIFADFNHYQDLAQDYGDREIFEITDSNNWDFSQILK
ncbi:McrB family protein [Fodinibius saliphilus]|uniref:McrB family protein n=1 Tax=Fodinibius saliphilus TaxID=1920650 RepID=UPI00110981F0|nr:AAA family ATPase [Fodinibius saliphilus]